MFVIRSTSRNGEASIFSKYHEFILRTYLLADRRSSVKRVGIQTVVSSVLL
jgi:hypothetical protein